MVTGKLLVSRPPTKGEIAFGYGCRHYGTVNATPENKGRKWILKNGLRWTVLGSVTRCKECCNDAQCCHGHVRVTP